MPRTRWSRASMSISVSGAALGRCLLALACRAVLRLVRLGGIVGLRSLVCLGGLSPRGLRGLVGRLLGLLSLVGRLLSLLGRLLSLLSPVGRLLGLVGLGPARPVGLAARLDVRRL